MHRPGSHVSNKLGAQAAFRLGFLKDVECGRSSSFSLSGILLGRGLSICGIVSLVEGR